MQEESLEPMIDQILEYIRKRKNKYCVYSRNRKQIACHKSRGQATKQLRAIEANKEYVKELRDQMKESQMDASHLNEISSAFANSLQMSEEVIDAIIDSHLRRVSQIVDFNRKSAEQLHQGYVTDKFDYEKFIALQQKNFEQSIELSTRDMKKIVEVYNKHINLSVNFSRNFSKNINAQIDTLVKFQTKGLQAYNNWVANWWEKDK